MSPTFPTPEPFGIEALAVALPRHALDLDALAAATKVDPAKYQKGLGGRRLAIPGPDEDTVTLAYAAARRLLRAYAIDPASIGLVLVGTESGIDESKPVAAYLHGFLGLSGRCATYDLKHACYSGTAAVKSALTWCRAQGARPRKALVVAVDIARYELGSPAEATQGAGAVAMLLGDRPALSALDFAAEAVWSRQVMDFWRPCGQDCAVVDGKFSVACYLEALEETFRTFQAEKPNTFADAAYHLFHLPFPRMAEKALARLAEVDPPAFGGLSFEERYARRVEVALEGNRRTGNAYSASLYLSLAGLLEGGGQGVANEQLTFFSYGSGCCAELFSGRIGPDARAWRGKIGFGEALARALPLDYPSYLEVRRQSAVLEKGASVEPPLPPAEPLCQALRFAGVYGAKRLYTAAED